MDSIFVADLKKLFCILLSFSVLALGMQSPCSAISATEESSCETSNCCKDEAPGTANEKDSNTNNTKKDGSCCVYNILTNHEGPSFDNNELPLLIIKNGFREISYLGEFLPDFWQPPRLA